jgi:outer membrane protein assembly factor BamB
MSCWVKSFTIVLVGLFLLSFFMLEPANGQAISSTPTLLWQKSFGFPAGTKDNSRVWTSPTILDGVLYVGAESAVNAFPYHPPSPDYIHDWWSDFYAFNSSNGEIIWDYRVDSAYMITSCVVKDGVVFFGAISDNLNYSDKRTYFLALNASSGTLLRTYNTQGGISTPLIVNDVVFFWGGTNDEGYILALNASSLDLLWEYKVNALVSGAAVVNDFVYFCSSRGNSTLYALNATNGRKIWAAPDYMCPVPTIVNGLIYVGYFSDGPNKKGEYILSYGLHALDASNGKLIWNYTTDFWVNHHIIGGGAVYFSSNESIYAINALTGAKLWNYSTNKVLSAYGQGMDYEFSSPTFTNGILYIFSNRAASMLALKASNGAKIWNYTRAVGDPPIVVNGAVYVDVEGCLCALDAYEGNRIWASNLPVNNMNIHPPSNPTLNNNVLYFSENGIFYALRLPISSSADMPPNILQALTDKGQTANLIIGGNITSSQISNVYLTSDNVSSALYFDVTGVSGDAGFGNITIPQALICNGTLPLVYIDDQIAEKQGYVTGADNYYVWYTTDFSTHQIAIMFAESSSSASTSAITLLIIGVTAIAFTAIIVALFVFRRSQKTK